MTDVNLQIDRTKGKRSKASDLPIEAGAPPQKSINYWVHVLSSSLAKSASSYYGRIHDTNLPEMRILTNLHSNGDMTARDLVNATIMDKGLVSRVLSGLEKKGYLELLADGDRMRLRRWTLTRKGRDLVARLQPEWARREAIIQACLTAAERKSLVDMLQRLFHSSEALRLEEKEMFEKPANAAPAKRKAKKRSR